MALFQYFSCNDLEQVHATVLRLMNEVGARFPHEPALQALKKTGCRVDADRVRFRQTLWKTLSARRHPNLRSMGATRSKRWKSVVITWFFFPAMGPPL